MLKIGNTDINKCYLGGDEVKKAYLGSDVVFDNSVVAFITTWNIASNGETLTLPTPTNYLVDWGDGTTDNSNSHVYTNSGVYTVQMFGVIDDWDNVDDIDEMLTIEALGGLQLGVQTFGNSANLGSCIGGDYNITGDSAFYLFGFSQNLTFRSSVSFNFNNVLDADCSILLNQCINLNTDISITGVTNSIDLEKAFRFLFVFNSNISLPSGIKATNLSDTFNRCFLITQDYLLLNNVDTSECVNFASLYSVCNLFNKDVSWMDFRSATNVSNFMAAKTSSNYDYQFYDNLLIKWASGAANGGLDFTKLTNLTTNFGSIQYSSVGAAARAFLVSQGLIITDGGNNGL